jgi:hypothetical protein
MNVLYSSCDVKYFLDHGYAFIKSAHTNGCVDKIIVDVVHLRDDNVDFVVDLGSFLGDVNNVLQKLLSEGYMEKATVNVKPVSFEPEFWANTRTYYACSRFAGAYNIKKKHPNWKLLILDIDSIIMNKLPFPDAPYGLFLRPNEPLSMQVAAGMVFIGDHTYSTAFIKNVYEYIWSSAIKKKDWFIDQIAVYTVHNTSTMKGDCFVFDKSHMDWEFDDTSAAVWTGKGDRKYNNKKYLTAKKSMSDRA